MILKEAKRLFDLGFAVHWIKPKSKVPVKSKWSGDTRDPWEVVAAEYRDGMGLGVRMGSASLVGGGYLANIDVDIKSGAKGHQREALRFAVARFPEIRQAPVVRTGNGFRFFVKTARPVKSGKVGGASEDCVVLMPSAPISQPQLAAVAAHRITQTQLDAGYRIRPAWEVELMSAGRQVVLPPSVHPDSGRPYRWERPVVTGGDIPLMATTHWEKGSGRERGRPRGTTVVQGFRPVVVDLVGSPLSDHIVDMILGGAGVEDRSAACFTVCLAMIRARFSDDEILSVLTDRTTYLGETAFDHRSTDSRLGAAAWVRDYCLAKARLEADAAMVFEAEVEVAPVLEDEAAITGQLRELVGEAENGWERRLDRAKHGGLKPTLENVVAILRNAVAQDLFRRDEFAMRDAYGARAPWIGGVVGAAVTDEDCIEIKHWLAREWSVEPPVGVVHEAVAVISRANGYHPVRLELEALPAWDGKMRIDGWLKRHFGARGCEEYLSQVFRKWLVASVTRVYEPGHKFDWMPILQGAQGTGKSSFGSLLFGENYFNDWLPNLADKDAALGLQGMRCHEFGELDSLRRNEIDTIKAFVTRTTDRVRPPYGRRQIEVRRQVVFFGTTNRDEYLKDDTGNRRFMPVEVGSLDFAALKRERDQLWAEALFIYLNRLEPHLYLEGKAISSAIEIQKEKMVGDESEFLVADLVSWMEVEKSKEMPDRFNFDRFKLVDLFKMGGPLNKLAENRFSLMMAAKALKLIRGDRRKIDGNMFWRIPL